MVIFLRCAEVALLFNNARCSFFSLGKRAECALSNFSFAWLYRHIPNFNPLFFREKCVSILTRFQSDQFQNRNSCQIIHFERKTSPRTYCIFAVKNRNSCESAVTQLNSPLSQKNNAVIFWLLSQQW